MNNMITTISEGYDKPQILNCPYYYQPHITAMAAIDDVCAILEGSIGWKGEIEQGKMFGVLVVEDNVGQLGYLKAYSGQICGREDWEGWVPAILDYLSPDGYFKRQEEEIDKINAEIKRQATNIDYQINCARLKKAERARDLAITEYKQYMLEQKISRDKRRNEGEDENTLIKESQFQKAELRRIKKRYESEISATKFLIEKHNTRIASLRKKRHAMSDKLQSWLFDNFIVVNGRKERKSLTEIFSSTPLHIPPSGAGECCAPKLLQYALTNNLKPLALAEFWWGNDKNNELRKHRNFYPACQGKCKPILDFMLQGIEHEKNPLEQEEKRQDLHIIYNDEYVIATHKPEGMLSVPGKSKRQSAKDILEQQEGQTLYPTHRLDMQTSGILLFARSKEIQSRIQCMFESREVKKIYIAELENIITDARSGEISLPLSPDYENRPRQRVDYANGKESITKYEIIATEENKTRLRLYPMTGRTHQLRIHCAHPDGLGCPIIGDDLYGVHADRLHLHAEYLSFTHPVTCERIEIHDKCPF